MSVLVVQSQSLVLKDPADQKTYCMDWDVASLRTSAIIQTSSWTITPIGPSTTDALLTKDNEAILTAEQATAALDGLRVVTADSRMTHVRLSAGTLGQVYEIANRITTNESPSQTKERSYRVLVQQQ